MVGNDNDEANDRPALRRSRSHNSSNFTYEHFPVVCPTCEGNGDLDEDLSGMVTFVPVKDERLRPAWTKVKIAALIFTILSIGGTTTYFLYPRDVTILTTTHQVQDFNFNGKYPWIIYQFTVHVNNNNFFPVKLKKFMLQLLYLQVQVGKKSLSETITVAIRTKKEVLISMNVTYDGDTARYIKQQCFKDQYFVPQLMLSSAQLSYWMHGQHIESKDDYFFTDCSSMVFPLPTKKSATKPTTHLISTHQTTKNTVSPNKTIVTIHSKVSSTKQTLLTAKSIKRLFPYNTADANVVRYKRPTDF